MVSKKEQIYFKNIQKFEENKYDLYSKGKPQRVVRSEKGKFLGVLVKDKFVSKSKLKKNKIMRL